MQSVLKITVFVASPDDVGPERDAVERAVEELNTVGIQDGRVVIYLKRWDKHTWPGFGEDPQDAANQQIGDYDIFVAIFWNRLGTPTKRAKSGTVEEFERAFTLWKQHGRPSLMFYFKKAPFAFKDARELKQKSLLLSFEKLVRKQGLIGEFIETDHFSRLIRVHLQNEIRRITTLLAVAATPALLAASPKNPAVDHVRHLMTKLGNWHAGPTREVLKQIHSAAAVGSREVKEEVIAGLRDYVMGALKSEDLESVTKARELRAFAFKIIRSCVSRDIASHFRGGELEAVDLVGFDFSGLNLEHVSFHASFAIEADFSNAVLHLCSFEDAWIRNADFVGASLKGADMTGADWFNSLNLTVEQLRSVAPGTLMQMPSNVNALHTFLKARYRLSFDSWTEEVRTRLVAAWQDYLKPDGLAAFVSRQFANR